MSPDIVEAVLRVSRAVRRRFSRMGSPADPDDVAQEAALAAIEVVAAGRLAAGKNARGYMYRAAVRETGLSTSRWLSKVSISEGQAKNARKYQHARTPEEAGLDQQPGGELPSDRLERAVAQAELRVWSARRARILDGYAESMDELDRKIVRMLFGLGDEPAPEGGVAEVAWRLGVDDRRVRRAVSSLRRAASGDFGLHRAMRNIIAVEDR